MLKWLGSNGEGKYIGNDLQECVNGVGITRELPIAFSPESNRRAERLIRAHLDMSRTALSGAIHTHRKALCSKAVNYGSDTSNLLRSRSGSKTKTSYELMHSCKPSVMQLYVFVLKAFLHIPSQWRDV